MCDLNGKKALVTGSSQGIGFAIAKLFAEHGAEVFVHGSDEANCRRAAEGIPNAKPVAVDLLGSSCADELYEATGDIDILVLNASIQYKRKWDEFSLDEYDIQMNCNFKSSYLLIRKYAEGMKNKNWGRIVTIGSVNQYNQHPELSLYGASKVAQKKLSENFAPILAPHGITINNVAPGAINTPRNEKVLNDSEFRNKLESAIPCGYIGEPDDITPAVLLLCSNEGRYITGAEIKIDGGMSL